MVAGIGKECAWHSLHEMVLVVFTFLCSTSFIKFKQVYILRSFPFMVATTCRGVAINPGHTLPGPDLGIQFVELFISTQEPHPAARDQ